MKTFKTIERKAQLLGLPMQDLFALLFGLSLAIVVGIILNFFVAVSKYYFLAVVVSVVGAFFLLKRINRRKHPSFLFSYLSYHLWQARKLEVWESARVRSEQKVPKQ